MAASPDARPGLQGSQPSSDGSISLLSTSGGRAGNVPPYWHAHQRTVSNVSYTSVRGNRQPVPIVLEDNTEDQTGSSRDVWAKGVSIDDYTVVTGPTVGAGSYVVWNCVVEMIDGSPFKIRKR
ncbi:MAG: PX domain-containing protein ypt35 [Chrysothrix sp. TS-e1954]|nr:MAG: PX domain-containing protein ypt35 [Chrysothrix sp. TS-e1954]